TAQPTEAPAEQRPRRRRGGRGRRARPMQEAPNPPVVVETSEEQPAHEHVQPKTRGRRTTRKAAERAEDLTVGARLINKKGNIELHINGVPRPPVIFFGNVEGEKETRRVISEAKRAAESDVHLYSTLIEIPCPLSPDDHVYELLDTRLQLFLEADPQAY